MSRKEQDCHTTFSSMSSLWGRITAAVRIKLPMQQIKNVNQALSQSQAHVGGDSRTRGVSLQLGSVLSDSQSPERKDPLGSDGLKEGI